MYNAAVLERPKYLRSHTNVTYLGYLEVPFETDVSEVFKVKVIFVRAVTHHGEEARGVSTLLEYVRNKNTNYRQVIITEITRKYTHLLVNRQLSVPLANDFQ